MEAVGVEYLVRNAPLSECYVYIRGIESYSCGTAYRSTSEELISDLTRVAQEFMFFQKNPTYTIKFQDVLLEGDTNNRCGYNAPLRVGKVLISNHPIGELLPEHLDRLGYIRTEESGARTKSV